MNTDSEVISIDDIIDAYERIKSRIHKTPVMTSSTINEMTGCKVFFKCENLQRVGAFKFRGALNALMLLDSESKAKGVIAHSSGNFAQALALAASMLGIHATIVMPANASRVKVDATRGYGAEVIFCRPTLKDREETTRQLIRERTYVDSSIQ